MNYPILRKEIESNSNYLINNNWKSNSDTETILKCLYKKCIRSSYIQK